MSKVSPKTALQLYQRMLRIRLIEEQIARIYPAGSMRTPVHFSIGQEAVSVGACAVLGKTDYIFASHRCHAAYLARGIGLRPMLAELFGRESGVCKGRSGSAHLCAPGQNFFASPILGQMLAIATGTAFSFWLDKSKRVAVAFFGDAAIEEGICHESINFAVLKKLPVIFICENNFYSTHTPIRFRQPPIPIYKRMRGLGIKAQIIDGNDVLKVYRACYDAQDACRKGKGPVFLECITYRYREHVGPNFDFENPFRTRKELASWMAKCPIKKLERSLLRQGILSRKKISLFRQDVTEEFNQAVSFAQNSAWPGKENLLQDVY